jgi:hypothetical protein
MDPDVLQRGLLNTILGSNIFSFHADCGQKNEIIMNSPNAAPNEPPVWKS